MKLFGYVWGLKKGDRLVFSKLSNSDRFLAPSCPGPFGGFPLIPPSPRRLLHVVKPPPFFPLCGGWVFPRGRESGPGGGHDSSPTPSIIIRGMPIGIPGKLRLSKRDEAFYATEAMSGAIRKRVLRLFFRSRYVCVRTPISLPYQ